MERWFTKAFPRQPPERDRALYQDVRATKLDGYIACGEAVRDMDHRALLPKIKPQVMIIAGRQDPATTVAMGESLRERIPGAKLAVVEGAHIANVEQPKIYAETVLNFLQS